MTGLRMSIARSLVDWRKWAGTTVWTNRCGVEAYFVHGCAFDTRKGRNLEFRTSLCRFASPFQRLSVR